MNLTTQQKKRLAKEMRGLAMECIANGPEMDNIWCGCAIGISMRRAGFSPEGGQAKLNAFERVAAGLDALLTDNPDFVSHGIVSIAVRERIYKANPTAVVFPLLALADLVEEAP